jgi:small multidrug resistance family-3 protein
LLYLFLRRGQSVWLLVPAAGSLAAFAWPLTLHPTGAARTHAAYGGVYIAVALIWLWLVEGERPTAWDIIGTLVALAGMAIIVLGPRR